MSPLRATSVLALLGGSLAAAQLLACGKDDPPAGGVAPVASSSGTVADASAPAPGSPTFTVSDTRASVYLGQTARLDGAAIAPVVTGFTWTVAFAPSGSTITTASLQEASTATPSFTPDVLGAFTLQGTGTKDGVDATVLVFVEAVDAPVFWREARVEYTTASQQLDLELRVAGANGGPSRAVACTPDSGLVGSFNDLFVASLLSAAAGDAWEAPAGTASRVVFPEWVVVDPEQGIVEARLVASTSAASCADTVTLERRVGRTSTDSYVELVQSARFSPNGNRVAYLHAVDGKPKISTTGFRGEDKRMLSAFQSVGQNQGGLDPDAGFVVTPQRYEQVGLRWLDDSRVGWITFVGAEDAGAEAWELYTVADATNAVPELTMHCASSRLYGFDFLPDGTILAAAGPTDLANLVVYRANATTKECEVVRQLTQNIVPGTMARDLALSPDKSTVAFLSGNESDDPAIASGFDLHTVPVDGSRPSAAVRGAGGSAAPRLAPRWLSGGSLLTWNRVQTVPDLDQSVGQVLAIPAAGGEARTLTQGHASVPADGNGRASVRLVYGVGQGCSAAGGSAPLSTFGLVAGLGMAAMLARRRRAPG